MRLTNNLEAIVSRIKGLQAVLNEPISSAIVPGTDAGRIDSSEALSFGTVGDFLGILDDNGATDILDNLSSASVENGELHFYAPMANKG